MKNKKLSQVYYETLFLDMGENFSLEYVQYSEGEQHNCFMHFHDLHELIFFEKVQGLYTCNAKSYALQNNSITFSPSMQAHNYRLTAHKNSWFILKISTEFFTEFFPQSLCKQYFDILSDTPHFTLTPTMQNRAMHLVAWMHSNTLAIQEKNNTNIQLLKLLIELLCENIGIPKTILGNETFNTPNKIKMPAEKPHHWQRLEPIIQHLAQGKVDINQQQAADMCKLSSAYFSRLFKQKFNRNFSEYLTIFKLQMASRMLSNTHLSITQIAYDLHFSSPSHFIAQFKQRFSITPKQYKKNLLNQD